MSKRKTPPAATLPQPLSLSLSSPLSVQFAPDANVKVTVATPDKPPFKLDWRLAALIWVSLTGLSLWFLLYRTHALERTHSPKPTPLTVKVVHPARAAFGDEVEMDVVITNQGADSFTGQVIISLEAAHPLPNETAAVKLEPLGSRESKTHRLKFELEPKACSLCGGIVRASLQTYSGAQQLSAVTGAEIPIARLPYARSLILWLRSSALTLAVAALLWEVMRKLVFKWEAK
jgi:hypothetical protein